MVVTPRPMCSRCRRPTSVCYCAAIPTLPTATRVVILQHPRERDMAIGTARMASLCLPQSELHVGVDWSDSIPLRRALADPARTPILLYPGPGARDILSDPPRGPTTLVVVDGTWSQAKTVVRDNPILHALPRYAFTTPEPSHYRIRREPRAEYVSTIEALMHVLGALEGNPAPFRALLAPFHAMVDAQLAAQAARPVRRYRQPRGPKPPRVLPEIFTTRFDDLVLVVGEANAWPYDRHSAPLRGAARSSGAGPFERHSAARSNGAGAERQVKHSPRDAHADELVHWVAVRPSTGETFEAFCAPLGALSPSTLFHTRLCADDLAGTRAALFDAFAGFTRPTDVIGSWGHYAMNLFVATGGTLPERVDLRAELQRLTNKKLGGVGEATPALGTGRAGARLAALLEHVRRFACPGRTPPG